MLNVCATTHGELCLPASESLLSLWLGRLEDFTSLHVFPVLSSSDDCVFLTLLSPTKERLFRVTLTEKLLRSIFLAVFGLVAVEATAARLEAGL